MKQSAKVAPHVGAWIEIDATLESVQSFAVAPHVGAWIEMSPPALTNY